MSNEKIRQDVLTYMESHATHPVSYDDLGRDLRYKGKGLGALWTEIELMIKDGLLVKTRFNTLGLPRAMGLVTGRLQVTQKGYGFVVPLEKTEEGDLFIPAMHLSGAMNEDLVIARVSDHGYGGRREGKVIRILERAHERFVGTFTRSGDFGFVTPDNRHIGQDIYVRRKDFLNARNGDKVVVKITVWPNGRQKAEGTITEILGKKGDVGIDIISIIKDKDLPLDFPKEVKEAAQLVPQVIPKKDLKGRLDRRKWPIITVDGVDSKDLDDAIYAEKRGEDYFLGVYIADVSHYVRPRGELDREAYARGTSVYLVDRVLPMLPPLLSNGICSLNEGEERLTMSCEMVISGKTGKVLSYDIAPSVIASRHRMNYPDVAKILTDRDTALREKYSDIVPMLETMEELCTILHKKRVRRGAIEFEIPEVKVILDEKKRPIDVHLRHRTIAEMMIEEFMLAANETVAAHMTKHHYPFIYRVHDVPDEDRMQSLSKIMAQFGTVLKIEGKMRPKVLQMALRKVKGKPEEGMISTLALRSMKQAVYQTENVGHFGLAAKDYTHFTSPIRRYPDLLVHRLLKEQRTGQKLSKKEKENLNDKLSLMASHASTRERLAIEAERETDELKMTEYMLPYVGQEFDGTISGVTSFGMFVQLENGIEGLVHISSLLDDYYRYDEEHFALVGEHGGKSYRLGSPVRIKVFHVSVEERKIDFTLPEFETFVTARKETVPSDKKRTPKKQTVKKGGRNKLASQTQKRGGTRQKGSQHGKNKRQNHRRK